MTRSNWAIRQPHFLATVFAESGSLIPISTTLLSARPASCTPKEERHLRQCAVRFRACQTRLPVAAFAHAVCCRVGLEPNQTLPPYREPSFRAFEARACAMVWPTAMKAPPRRAQRRRGPLRSRGSQLFPRCRVRGSDRRAGYLPHLLALRIRHVQGAVAYDR